jgi:ABC-type transporter MlaC component
VLIAGIRAFEGGRVGGGRVSGALVDRGGGRDDGALERARCVTSPSLPEDGSALRIVEITLESRPPLGRRSQYKDPMRPLLLALSLSLASVSAFAGEGISLADPPVAAAKAPASEFVDGKLKTLRTLLGQPVSADRDKKLDAELVALLDYDDMAKVALDKEYGSRTKEEIAEFKGLLKQLIEKNYKKKLQETLKYDIKIVGETKKNDDAVVQTEAKNTADAKAQPVKIDYVVRKKGTSFIVVDIIVEDSAMVSGTYKKEFARTIKKDGWAGLIKKMKDKLAQS